MGPLTGKMANQQLKWKQNTAHTYSCDFFLIYKLTSFVNSTG